MEITAVFVKDTKRFHRYEIEGTEVSGSLYISREMDPLPKQITVNLTVKTAGKAQEEE